MNPPQYVIHYSEYQNIKIALLVRMQFFLIINEYLQSENYVITRLKLQEDTRYRHGNGFRREEKNIGPKRRTQMNDFLQFQSSETFKITLQVAWNS